MPSRLDHGANAAGDTGACVDGRIVLHDLVNLPVEDASVKVVQQLLILADNLEMHTGLPIAAVSSRIPDESQSTIRMPTNSTEPVVSMAVSGITVSSIGRVTSNKDVRSAPRLLPRSPSGPRVAVI